jgi:hypothetical protein
LNIWKQATAVFVVAAGSVAAGVAVGGQVREVDPPKVVVANKAAEPVPVAAVVTRMPVVRLEPDTSVELGLETIARLREPQVVRALRTEWEYKELRVTTTPMNYRSVVTQLNQAGAEGWESTGVTFSDAGATVMIMKRVKQPG